MATETDKGIRIHVRNLYDRVRTDRTDSHILARRGLTSMDAVVVEMALPIGQTGLEGIVATIVDSLHNKMDFHLQILQFRIKNKIYTCMRTYVYITHHSIW